MKIFLRSCLLFLLIFTSMTTTYAENSSSFIGNYPFFDGYRLAKVHFVGARNTFGEQAIFLKTHNIIIKIYSKNYTHIHGNEIAGYFNKTEKQMLYNYKTGESFEGQVLCKRLLNPNLPVVEPNNIYIKGENNTYANNTVIKGENNISRNNVYIAGSNNTITGNTHYQGSNNVYENNVIIGSSNNTITNTTTYGSSNRIAKGKVIDNSNTKKYSNFFAFFIYFLVLLFWYFSCKKIFLLWLSPIILIILVQLLGKNTIKTLLPYIGYAFACSIAIWCVYELFAYRKEKQEQREIYAKQKIEWEQRQQEIERENQEKILKYQKEQERISTLPTHYVGNVETGKYHHCICSYARKLHESKKEYFETAEAAESVGYIPCSICKPNQNCEIYVS